MLLDFFSIRWEHEIKGVFKQANSRKTGSEYRSVSCGRHSVNQKIVLLPLILNTKTFYCHLCLSSIYDWISVPNIDFLMLNKETIVTIFSTA